MKTNTNAGTIMLMVPYQTGDKAWGVFIENRLLMDKETKRLCLFPDEEAARAYSTLGEVREIRMTIESAS